ncbi:MAG: hypothetical protein MJ069_02440 [Salinivirgaceae bacterium]|nr:hypothetical protein [Salinivirgaceae bacterium]
MKLISKVIVGLAILVCIPFIVGFCLPKDRVVDARIMIDQMYFEVLSNVSNHWEEPIWRTEVDSMVELEQIDARDVWMEYYTNGDSVKLQTQSLGEFDYIRMIICPDGTELNRNITLVNLEDAEGNMRTVVRYVEEVHVTDPLKRFVNLFNDKYEKRAHRYLFDLKNRGIQQKQEMEEMNSGW